MARPPRATTEARRTPGRPFAAGAPDTRKAIVAAARRLLERHMPAQVSNSMIAREAGADPALIRYYFGDRTALLLAVVAELMASAGEASREPPAGVEEQLRERIASTLRLSRTTRSMQRIMIDELAESDSPAVRDEVRSWNKRAVGYFADLLAGADDDAIVGVDPLFLHIAILGVCEFFTSAQSIVRPLAEPAVDAETLAQQYEVFVADLFLNGLRRR